MVNEKYIIAIDAADDAGMWPASRLSAVTCAADGTVLVRFNSGVEPGGGTAAANDLVTLTVTADKEKVVMQEIARVLHANGPGYSDGPVVLCDDVNSVFLHPDILSCTITLDT
tara:strand:+ start:551 stop:889 length:339 start_codon:yes stop_codon:yes gene_type:complete